MKFDSNLAWKQASSSIGANREVLLALSGVFFLLPSLAFALLLPQPAAAAGQSEAQQLAAMRSYLTGALPFFIPMALVQAAGTLAMLTLFTDKSRPTVGQAIRLGLAGILTYIAAQLVLAVGIGVLGGVALTLGAVTGVPVVAVLAVAAVVLFAIYAWIKTSLVAPIVSVERERNPFAALRRSWRLTKGNSLRIGLFYALLFIAFFVVLGVIAMIVGLVLAALGGAEAVRIGDAIVSSTLGAVMTLYLVAVMAAVHRQLAGPSPEAVSAPFE
jgi:hypothetical protein